MGTLVTTPAAVIPPPICDFGWYYGVTPSRLAEASFKVGSATYPPGATALSSSAVLSATTPYTLNVGSTASFETTGRLVVNNNVAHQTVTYTGVTANTFTGCLGGSGTFAAGTAVYDPRFYVDQAPLQQSITFDAIDSLGFGLPITIFDPASPVVNYRWNFGNGQTGFGATATVYYAFAAAPSIQTTLTITDSQGRLSSCAHRVNLQSLNNTFAATIRISQGPART